MAMSGAVAPLVPLDGAVTAGAVAVTSDGLGAGRILPVREDIAAVLPWHGLRRGSTVAISGPGSLLLALLAAATAHGSWAAAIGLPSLGLLAAREYGVAVDRLALIPRPGSALVTVAGALLDGMDLVALPGGVTAGQARKLAARARHRRSVLLSVGPWPGADVELRCLSARWQGLGAGHGHLRSREVTLRCGGRGGAAAGRTTTLLLPGAESVPGSSVPGSGVSGSGAPGSGIPGSGVSGPAGPRPVTTAVAG